MDDNQNKISNTGSLRRVPTDSFAAITPETTHVTAVETPEVVTLTRAEYEALLVDRERVNTYKHIQKVECYLHKMIKLLIKRAETHDRSKLSEPEAELFAMHGYKLKDLEYGSEEYNESLKVLSPALEHHYANNRHHPEHFKNGIEDMNLIDVLEMLCDWKASSERTSGGNLRKSLEENAKRFNMDPMLVQILENSIDLLTE
jgi:hypothetical protein